MHARLRLPLRCQELMKNLEVEVQRKTDNVGAMFISRRVPTALQVLTLTSGINLFAANILVKLLCSMKDDDYTWMLCCRAQTYWRDAAFMTSKMLVLFPRTDVFSQSSGAFASTCLGMCHSNMCDISPCNHCNQRIHSQRQSTFAPNMYTSWENVEIQRVQNDGHSNS